MKSINLVALVDDDQIALFIEKSIINSTHLVNKIKTFSNGKEALDFLKNNSIHPELLPEIILLDLNMPVMDGWSFLEGYLKLPDLEKKIVIYIVSSSVSTDEIKIIKAMSGVSGYIIKPITKEKFERIVAALLLKPVL